MLKQRSVNICVLSAALFIVFLSLACWKITVTDTGEIVYGPVVIPTTTPSPTPTPTPEPSPPPSPTSTPTPEPSPSTTPSTPPPETSNPVPIPAATPPPSGEGWVYGKPFACKLFVIPVDTMEVGMRVYFDSQVNPNYEGWLTCLAVKPGAQVGDWPAWIDVTEETKHAFKCNRLYWKGEEDATDICWDDYFRIYKGGISRPRRTKD